MNTLETHASRISPELHECEARLQFVLEGVGRMSNFTSLFLSRPRSSTHFLPLYLLEDKLLFRFLRLDPSEPQREFSIVVDASSREYRG